MNATATVGTRAPNAATVEIRLRDTDLSRLPLKPDQALEGTISADIQASGELEYYERGSASAQVSKFDLVWNGIPVSAEGPLAAAYANRTVTIQKAALRAAGSRVELEGSLPLDRTAGEGIVDLNAQLDLPGIARLANAAKLEVQGQASIRGTVRGTMQRLDPNLSVSLENASLAMEGLNPPIANAFSGDRFGTGRSRWSRYLRIGARHLCRPREPSRFALLPANLPVEIPRRQGPAKLTAALNGVSLAAIPGTPAQASGTFSVRLEAEAPRPELEAAMASLTFPELRAGFSTYTDRAEGDVEVRSRERRRSRGAFSIDRAVDRAGACRNRGHSPRSGARPAFGRQVGCGDRQRLCRRIAGPRPDRSSRLGNRHAEGAAGKGIPGSRRRTTCDGAAAHRRGRFESARGTGWAARGRFQARRRSERRQTHRQGFGHHRRRQTAGPGFFDAGGRVVSRFSRGPQNHFRREPAVPDGAGPSRSCAGRC